MGTRSPQTIAENVAVTASYPAIGAGVVVDVGPSDQVLVGMSVAAGISTLDIRFIADGKVLHRAEGTSTVLEQVSHDSSTYPDFCVRLNTEGIKSLEIQTKGNTTGTINAITVSRTGSATHTPPSDLPAS